MLAAHDCGGGQGQPMPAKIFAQPVGMMLECVREHGDGRCGMEEAEFIKEFMALTGCNEAAARSVYMMHAGAPGSPQPAAPAAGGQNAVSTSPVNSSAADTPESGNNQAPS